MGYTRIDRILSVNIDLDVLKIMVPVIAHQFQIRVYSSVYSMLVITVKWNVVKSWISHVGTEYVLSHHIWFSSLFNYVHAWQDIFISCSRYMTWVAWLSPCIFISCGTWFTLSLLLYSAFNFQSHYDNIDYEVSTNKSFFECLFRYCIIIFHCQSHKYVSVDLMCPIGHS